MSDAKVELIDVTLKGCDGHALVITNVTSETTFVATRCEFANSSFGAVLGGRLTSATFNNCVFHDNSRHGIHAYRSTIHLHGEATAIHSNGDNGINAYSSKFVIHLPSHHNTTYNNGREDRRATRGGTITNVED